jgi:hypothetical protein
MPATYQVANQIAISKLITVNLMYEFEESHVPATLGAFTHSSTNQTFRDYSNLKIF